MPITHPLLRTELESALTRRYPLPGWVLTFHVPLPCTAGRPATVDALAIACTAAHGHQIHGFHLIGSRDDWDRQRHRHGGAARPDCCHQFHLVAPFGVLHQDDLPDGWGWLEYGTSKFRVRHPATVREATLPGLALTATWLRQAVNHPPPRPDE